MDIDYMEDYKDFTVHPERFPDLTALSAEMKEQGLHFIPIIDAGVKIEKGYDVYEDGVKNNYFCKRGDIAECPERRDVAYADKFPELAGDA